MTIEVVKRDTSGRATVIDLRESEADLDARQAALKAQRETGREVAKSLRGAFEQGVRDSK